MKRKIVIVVVLIIVLIAAKKGYQYYQKYRGSEDIYVTIDKFQFPELNLSSIFGEVLTKVTIIINNYSPETFHVQQLQINVLGENNEMLAEQQYPIHQPLTIKPNQANKFALNLLLSPFTLKQLIKSAGGIATVGANYLVNGKYNIPIQIVGFVRAEGIKIPINEKIIV